MFISSPFGELKKYGVRPNWDERRSVRGATQLRPANGFKEKSRCDATGSQPHSLVSGLDD
jgi:hypothetical protein